MKDTYQEKKVCPKCNLMQTCTRIDYTIWKWTWECEKERHHFEQKTLLTPILGGLATIFLGAAAANEFRK